MDGLNCVALLLLETIELEWLTRGKYVCYNYDWRSKLCIVVVVVVAAVEPVFYAETTCYAPIRRVRHALGHCATHI